ncbi:FecR domain-containing protein [Candidatus Dojkabacteria bacterium]|uniref:FecR domain-containing protein n=1 Tax=Candidatus Dojkabacteria bacterium TaxID=2099670 RepID=A0A955L8E9_9BACT|nr:FecR domain-containing protein [Candidatus Dojkabacteria bacterium]
MFSKYKIPIVICLFLLLFGVLVYAHFSSSEEIPPVTLYAESEGIFYKLPENDSYIELTNEAIELPNDSSIKTTTGTGYVIFADNSMMSIDRNTEVEIEYEYENIKITQLIGNTWHRVKKIVRAESRYIVETPTTLAAVRGTKFGVYTGEDGDTSVYVIDGNVGVGKSGLNPEQLRLVEKLLTKGKLTIVKRNQNIGDPENFTVNFTGTDWYKKNILIDQLYDTSIMKNSESDFKLDTLWDEIKNNPNIANFLGSDDFDLIFGLAPEAEVKGISDEQVKLPEETPTATPTINPTDFSQPSTIPTSTPSPAESSDFTTVEPINTPTPSPSPTPTSVKILNEEPDYSSVSSGGGGGSSSNQDATSPDSETTISLEEFLIDFQIDYDIFTVGPLDFCSKILSSKFAEDTIILDGFEKDLGEYYYAMSDFTELSEISCKDELLTQSEQVEIENYTKSYLFHYQFVDPYALFDSIEQTYNIFNSDIQLCDNFTQETIQSDIVLVQVFNEEINDILIEYEYDHMLIVEYLETVENSCSDSEINEQEQSNLEELARILFGEPVPTSEEFRLHFQDTYDLYSIEPITLCQNVGTDTYYLDLFYLDLLIEDLGEDYIYYYDYLTLSLEYCSDGELSTEELSDLYAILDLLYGFASVQGDGDGTENTTESFLPYFTSNYNPFEIGASAVCTNTFNGVITNDLNWINQITFTPTTDSELFISYLELVEISCEDGEITGNEGGMLTSTFSQNFIPKYWSPSQNTQ